MKKKIITVALVAILVANSVANKAESLKAFGKGDYLDENSDYNDKSNERDASVSDEGGRCGESIEQRDSHGAYEKDDSWNRNRHVGYSASASAAASADSSAKTYEHNHKGNVYI